MVIKDLVDCERNGYYSKYPATRDEINKESSESDHDITVARDLCMNTEHKWSIISAYFSMYHSTRAVAFSMGRKIDKHECVAIFLDTLVDKGMLEKHYAANYKGNKYLREQADYSSNYSEETANTVIENAVEFNDRMRQLIK